MDEAVQLTDKQELFCREYLIDLCATKAYMRAYDNQNYASSAVMASNLLKDINISTRIKQLMAERVERLNIDQNWVILSLLDIRSKSSKAEPVIKFNFETKAMEETGEYVFDSNGANKATELIGKHLGLFKDKLEVTAPEGIIIHGKKFSQSDDSNQNT